jgi:hypothetical protein
MEFLGEELSCSQYLIARHHDTKHEHIHIIASRIRMDGSVVSDSWDYRRSEVIVRQLEKEFNLEPTPCSNERVALIATEQGIETTVSDRRAPNQKQKHHHSGLPTVKQRLAALIDEACSDSPTVKQLIGRLQHQGVKVFPQFSTRGLFKEAIAFELDGLKVAGNKLGEAYSFPGLQRKRGVRYDPERDLPALHLALSGEVIELSEPEIKPEPLTSPSQQQQQEPTPPLERPATFYKPAKVSQEWQRQVAEQNYLIAWLTFQRAKVQGFAKEIAKGTWSYQDQKYAFVYNELNNRFAVVHSERGELARYEAGKLLAVGIIEVCDIEAFTKYEKSRKPPQSFLSQPPQSQPQQKPKSQWEMG